MLGEATTDPLPAAAASGHDDPPADALRRARGQTVLIAEFDLYSRSSVGGGQTSYRKLIEQTPDTKYYYFIRSEDAGQSRPGNTTAIPYREVYLGDRRDLPSETHYLYDDYVAAWQMAGSAKLALGPNRIDVIDTPDYRTIGLFLRGAMVANGIDVGVVALALHGTVSSAFQDEWDRANNLNRMLAELRVREHLQYAVADARYALSETYADKWAAYGGSRARVIDPLTMVGAPQPVARVMSGLPKVVFIGRRERRKGPDLFLDLCWCLRPDSFAGMSVIGGESVGYSGVGSEAQLRGMAALRRIEPEFIDHASPDELQRIFQSRAIVVLPSRYDQFNLVALEALRWGCPVVVSEHAGVATWIRQTLPEIADLITDISCSRIAASTVQHVIDHYDLVRARIARTIMEKRLTVQRDTLRDIYVPIPTDLESRRLVARDLQSRLDSFNRPRPLDPALSQGEEASFNSFSGRALIGAFRAVRTAIRGGLATKAAVVRTLRSWHVQHPRTYKRLMRRRARAVALRLLTEQRFTFASLYPSGALQVFNAAAINATRRRLLHQPERTRAEIDAKLAGISAELSTMKVGRVHIFRDMARMERKRPGGDLVAAVYGLRLLRWTGRDEHGDLGFIVNTLRKHDFNREADAAEAMFGDPALAFERTTRLLRDQYAQNLTKPERPLAVLDDRRGDAKPRVSVIVSLYRAASKLPTLLDNMRSQSLARAGGVEVVLVDSGSPTDEYAVFQAYAAQHDLPIVFARSQERETIQSAWNRGIRLARGPYLSFLGVDEGLHPEALSILSRRLDTEPDVDWVMADSLVTEVDKNGVFVKDVMPYDRRGYDQNLIHLETCYLSWVGGLYRKSIHDRFGYYDETFRAAGDTEFKERLLRHIRTVHEPNMLGVFNNYPEERTTQHPRAEIEDLRAWYMHRTPAGLAYSFDNAPLEEVHRLFRHCLSYRKSFCGHLSTDFDMASAIAEYLTRRGEDPTFAAAAMAVARRWRHVIGRIEEISLHFSARHRQVQMFSLLRKMRVAELEDQAAFGLSERPCYMVFSDNRFEQHWWSWSG